MTDAGNLDRLTYRATSNGLREYGNSVFRLSGGFLRAGGTPRGTVGAGFVVFDVPSLNAGQPAETCHLARVEIFLLADRPMLIHGLINIEVHEPLRRHGIGTRLVQSLAATTPGGQLEIYDIQADALSFWVKLGCSFHPRPPAWEATYTQPLPRPGGQSRAVPEEQPMS